MYIYGENFGENHTTSKLHQDNNTKMFRLCLCILFVAALIEIQADDSRIMKKDKVRLCGRRLPEMLKYLCKSKYYGKRSGEYNNLNTEYENEDVQDLEEYFSYPFRSRMDAFSMIPDAFRQSRGQKRGIVDECCRHSCNVDELLSYCE